MDVHPNCLMVAMGSEENLRVYTLTDELRSLFFLPLKHCFHVKYSTLGNYLDVVYAGN
jgi:hypothetical protein